MSVSKSAGTHHSVTARSSASAPNAAASGNFLMDAIAVSNCTTCLYYDGDGFCALPEDDKAITGYIAHTT